jgi:hypothetical protein
LYVSGTLQYGPVKDLVNFGGISLDATRGDMMTEKVQFQEIELAFLWVAVQFRFSKGVQYKADMLSMLCNGVRPDHDVIQIDVTDFSKIFA